MSSDETTGAALAGDRLTAVLIERGALGVTCGDVALTLPAARRHSYGLSDFDSDACQDDRVTDLGPYGAGPRALAGALARFAAIVRRGAVLTIGGGRWDAADPGCRVVLEGWSPLPPVHRDLPTAAELDIGDPAGSLAAALTAAGPGGMPRQSAAWWPGGVLTDGRWQAAVVSLAAAGWDLRAYHRLAGGDTWVQAAGLPGQPMRPPAEVPPEPRDDRYGWPEHGYAHDPVLWDAIVAAEDSRQHMVTWTGGWGRSNPLRSWDRPVWYGQALPGGEEMRAMLLAWAEEHGHGDVAALAVAGSVRLVTGPLEATA